jgi:DNA-binding NtrC family response regulator
VLLTDVILPGAKDGIELLDHAKQLDPNVGVIVITALEKVDPAVRAMKSGASDYLVKPVTPETLQAAVQRACPCARCSPRTARCASTCASSRPASASPGRSTASGSCRWRSPRSPRSA